MEIHAKKAPGFGGFWEHLVGLTKSAIKEVLGRAHISLQMLQTIVVEVEALLNNRPLTYISHDPNNPEPLTPSICCLDKGLQVCRMRIKPWMRSTILPMMNKVASPKMQNLRTSCYNISHQGGKLILDISNGIPSHLWKQRL